MSLRWILFAGLAAAGAAQAHEQITTRLTWSREVSRIVHRRCASCHRAGGPAPMPLIRYEDARPWAAAIAEEVLERRMPPWAAVKGFGEFRHEMALSQEEITVIADWATGGAPEGDPALAPPASPPPKAPPQPRPIRARRLPLRDTLRLHAPVRLIAIRPSGLAEGASVQITAERPDGAAEPLLWIRNHRARFTRDYEFRAPILLPPGTRLTAAPPGAGSVTLLIGAR
ncbi:MAG TPA: hypothetical protein DEH78_24285 [Solibacterales bacterium]|nr:hypothetical protein [Bryobacterales bacterium]